MKVISTIENYQATEGCSLTIGTFDGVHIGHREIIDRLVKSAREKNHLAVVLTFFPHPRMVLQKDTSIRLIDTLKEKQQLLSVFHDVLIVLGIFSLTYSIMPFNMEINQAFIAAILTVIGYSLNDTVVVFDRIREYTTDHPKSKLDETVNSALNSTLSRTLNTSLTTLLVLLAIFVFGGESIRGFMFALIVGVLVGTYSSVFIATPVMFDTQNKKEE